MAPPCATIGAGLVAVLLITRTRPGPRLVFQYPADANHLQNGHEHDSDDSETEADEPVRPVKSSRSGAPAAAIAKLSLNEDVASNGNGEASSNQVLGISLETLEKILSPGRWSDQKKFEICVNGLTFLGHPVYSPTDGDWSPMKETDETETQRPTSKQHNRYGEYHMYLDPGSLASTPPAPGRKAEHDFTHIPESLDSQKGGFASSMESTSTASASAPEQMTMFQVVFAIRSSGQDGQREAKAIYKDVAKILSKALHYCQKQSNYVGVESRRLLALKTKAKQSQTTDQELSQQMTETSELAWALKEIYDRISVGEIAGIRLNGMEMSLKVTGNVSESETVNLDPLSALLLLEDKETLLHQLSHPDATPLAHFIRELTPTKNLQKHSSNLGVPINDLLYLAQHLIKWRKARTIMPLNQRNIYIVSQDAPIDELHQLTERYLTTFPTLPSLPNMLKVLSGKPIKYGVLIPSRDHRGAYMDILSFLMRHKLVVQLKTFGWLRIPKTLATIPQHERTDPNKRPMSVRSLLSPHLRPVDDDSISVSSDRTAIVAPTNRPLKRLSSGTQSSNPSQKTSKGDTNGDFVIVTKPTEPTEEQAKLLENLQLTLNNSDFRENFSQILPHLDGEHAFEEIAARQGLKRSKVEEWLSDLEKKGWLMTVRYT